MALDPELVYANANRIGHLRSLGIPVAGDVDLLRVSSLLEFLIGDRLDEAEEFHQRRIALILANAEANVEVAIEQRQAAENRRKLTIR